MIKKNRRNSPNSKGPDKLVIYYQNVIRSDVGGLTATQTFNVRYLFQIIVYKLKPVAGRFVRSEVSWRVYFDFFQVMVQSSFFLVGGKDEIVKFIL